MLRRKPRSEEKLYYSQNTQEAGLCLEMRLENSVGAREECKMIRVILLGVCVHTCVFDRETSE